MKIIKGRNGELRVTVKTNARESMDEGMQIAANETLMLETRVRYGIISFEESDLRFMYPNFHIPPYITTSLQREYIFELHFGEDHCFLNCI